MNRFRWIVAGMTAAIILTALVELSMGRLLFGPDGRFAWWEGDVWSSEQSQRFADPYSFTHVIHGLLFYALLWLAARRVPARYRFLIAVILECVWEIFENSPFVINRYRTATIALGYAGDSIINSLSDVLMMSLGFLFAIRTRLRTCVALALFIEAVMLLWVRDNLTLNLVMLIRPVAAIKAWQMGGRPLP